MTRPEEDYVGVGFGSRLSKTALRYEHEVSSTPMGKAGLEGIRHRNLTAELGGAAGIAKYQARDQPPAWQVQTPLPAQCVFGGRPLQIDLGSREMLARLDNRWIDMAGVCAGVGGPQRAKAHRVA